MNGFEFDVFLSYNRDDAGVAEEVREALERLGLAVWFDTTHAGPGIFTENIASGISSSRAFAMLYGPSGVTDFMRAEYDQAVAVGMHANISIVLLPGADDPGPRDLPHFAAAISWVDCRSDGLSQPALHKLVNAVTRRRLISSVDQAGEEFSVSANLATSPERIIRVRALPNPKPHELLDLTWETFGGGVKRLRHQIKSYGHYVDVGACVGVNECGLVLASFLSSSVLGRKPVGYLKCGGLKEGRRILEDESSFPDLNGPRAILVTDFELKSGSGLLTAIERLREEYGKDVQIYVAVFGVLVTNGRLRIEHLEEIAAWEKIANLGVQAYFVASTFHDPGIDPPLGLR